MREPVLLPQYGMSMTEGTIVSWFKAVGDRVTEGEPLVMVEASKTEVEMEAPTCGVLVEVIVAEDETVPVQSVLAYIETDRA
jgi:pyruvate/2-oxoglutarate dehydrogenase complex dihydrolipoamide acyltransferase (E2) component